MAAPTSTDRQRGLLVPGLGEPALAEALAGLGQDPEVEALLLPLLPVDLDLLISDAATAAHWGDPAGMCSATSTARGCAWMPPEEDARAILRLQILAGARLPEELLELQDFAVKARDSPEDPPLPASRERLLALIRQLRGVLEERLQRGEA